MTTATNFVSFIERVELLEESISQDIIDTVKQISPLYIKKNR